ncbi:MAG: nucleotidyltransferase family protein, partial [Aestuariivirgaceae bacterium]
AVWDQLHGFAQPSPLNDIDVLYFDPTDLSIEQDVRIEEALLAKNPDWPWSVHNQARMHVRNNDEPYRSTADAISYWLETATGVAVTLDGSNELTVIAPFGLSDLIGMQSRPTVAGRARPEWYRQRMSAKNWPGTWPKVQVFGLA